MEGYIKASEAAALLSEKFGRRIAPDYIRKIRNIRKIEVDLHLFLYHKGDILEAHIRKHKND
jgi:hypothetical protein